MFGQPHPAPPADRTAGRRLTPFCAARSGENLLAMSFWRRRINRHWRRRRERRDGSAATLLERLPAGGAGRAAILAAA